MGISAYSDGSVFVTKTEKQLHQETLEHLVDSEIGKELLAQHELNLQPSWKEFFKDSTRGVVLSSLAGSLVGYIADGNAAQGALYGAYLSSIFVPMIGISQLAKPLLKKMSKAASPQEEKGRQLILLEAMQRVAETNTYEPKKALKVILSGVFGASLYALAGAVSGIGAGFGAAVGSLKGSTDAMWGLLKENSDMATYGVGFTSAYAVSRKQVIDGYGIDLKIVDEEGNTIERS